MAVTDDAITLVAFLKMEAPAGDVRLCDGGFIDFASERYESEHSVYGSLIGLNEFESGFGDLAEGGNLAFQPNPDAALSDWYRSDMEDARVRIWLGELDSDGVTVSSAELLADLLVDTVGIELLGGAQVLQLELISRSEKLFLINEGNVCSTRHHTQQFTGERGFDNCTGIPGYLAWGVAAPQATTAGSGGGGNDAPNRNVVEQ